MFNRDSSIVCRLYNRSQKQLLSDTLYLILVGARAQAQLWQTGSHCVAAVMEMTGKVRRTLFDRFTRLSGELYLDGNLREFSLCHEYWRDGRRQNGFLTNTEVKLHAVGENKVELFSQGDE